jgi:hypothetical protein
MHSLLGLLEMGGEEGSEGDTQRTRRELSCAEQVSARSDGDSSSGGVGGCRCCTDPTSRSCLATSTGTSSSAAAIAAAATVVRQYFFEVMYYHAKGSLSMTALNFLGPTFAGYYAFIHYPTADMRTYLAVPDVLSTPMLLFRAIIRSDFKAAVIHGMFPLHSSRPSSSPVPKPPTSEPFLRDSLWSLRV